MFSAKKSLVVLAVVGTLMFLAAPAVADWVPEDGHKMHWAQMPDPDGWDIRFDSVTLADDWECSETGPVSDIHFWFSWYGDQPANITQVHTSIHKDIPAGVDGIPYSRPVYTPEWTDDFNAGQFTTRHIGEGDQGWYDPRYDIVNYSDHLNYYQLNISGIEDPFTQTEGEIYWLDLQLYIDPADTGPPDYTPIHIGWKTTLNLFNDSAVYFDGVDSQWVPIEVPLEDGGFGSVDMAFVITPEPGTLVLLVTAGLGLLLFAWRRRK